MLTFIRKYQRLFFIVVTVLITISFAVSPAIGGFSGPSRTDSEAFVAVNGKSIPHSELAQMRFFLSTDATDKLMFGGSAGPNFLNDGLIRRDILQTGLGQVLVDEYIDLIQSDLRQRHERERRFTGYQHPHAPFLSAENVWGYFSPAVKEGLDTLRDISDPLSADAFAARTSLYLAEQNFPQQALKEVLRYQEKQYDWVQPDTLLERRDLALFGHRTLEDWFGPSFLTLVSEFVINASLIAEEQGYKVSKAEAWADLQHNAEISFQQAHLSPLVTASNGGEYLEEHLRNTGMDRATATKVWQRVLLFRRYFDDVGNSALLDKLAFEKFQGYANETVVADQYTLPIHLDTYRDLQAFEAYLTAIGDPEMVGRSHSLETLLDNNPELVQKPYLLEVTTAEKTIARQQIPLREVWNWQLDAQNWPALVTTVPTLAAAAPASRDDRFEALQSLSKADRLKLDRLAQDGLLSFYNSWIPEALNDAHPTEQLVRLTFDPEGEPLPGVTDPLRLMSLLDKEDHIDQYSDDGEHFYRFAVLERPTRPIPMTYHEALDTGTLAKTTRNLYSAHYRTVRTADPDKYQYDDHSWKRLSEVRDQLANTLLNTTDGEKAARTRFHDHCARALTAIQAGDTSPIRTTDANIANQWKLTKAAKTFTRDVDTDAYTLAINEWSPLRQIPGQDPYFYQVTGREPGSLTHERRVDFARDALSAEAQRALMHTVVTRLSADEAISLTFLNPDA